MKLQLISGELDTQETNDIIKMISKVSSGFGFGANRTYKNTDKVDGVLKIRVENTLLKGSNKFRNVFVKPIYK
jgi:hypothetical protein